MPLCGVVRARLRLRAGWHGRKAIDILKPDTLPLVFVFLVPGLIIVFVRSKFIVGRRPTLAEAILVYVILSAIFYCAAFPLLEWAQTDEGPIWLRVLRWFGLTIAGPALFGVGLGVFTQRQLGTRLAARFGLSIVHVIPAAWDWRFSGLPKGGMFMKVTLTSGGSVYGLFGSRSFASSDGGERDLYIEEEYEVDAEGRWLARPERVGILISSKEIRYIEFWDPT